MQLSYHDCDIDDPPINKCIKERSNHTMIEAVYEIRDAFTDADLMITAYALETRYRSSHIKTRIAFLLYRKALQRGLTSRRIRWGNRAYEVGHSLLSIFDIHLYDHRSAIHSYSHIVLSSVYRTKYTHETN